MVTFETLLRSTSVNRIKKETFIKNSIQTIHFTTNTTP